MLPCHSGLLFHAAPHPGKSGEHRIVDHGDSNRLVHSGPRTGIARGGHARGCRDIRSDFRSDYRTAATGTAHRGKERAARRPTELRPTRCTRTACSGAFASSPARGLAPLGSVVDRRKSSLGTCGRMGDRLTIGRCALRIQLNRSSLSCDGPVVPPARRLREW